MASPSSIVPSLVSSAHSIIDAMKNDPSTSAKTTALLTKASNAIMSVQNIGPSNALSVASNALTSIGLDSAHPLAAHLDAANQAISTAQKFVALFG